jgi:SOS-response transcriptional repressor LexA
MPENQAYAPIEVAADIRDMGRVIGVMRKY